MATALLVLSSILVGAVWPLLIEQFSVRPNAADKESPYIERNIAATRQAYGITDDKVEYQDYPGVGTTAARATFRPTSPPSPTPGCWIRTCCRARSPSSSS